ncbi:MAG: hypothetical protein HUU55_20595 [Myxococcales bacterium]|nr:hypothetical protein [Myxococcales bacterium]
MAVRNRNDFFFEFVKKYGDGLGRGDFVPHARKKTESYREYGAGFFGAKLAKSRGHQGAQLFFHKLFGPLLCSLFLVITLTLLGCETEDSGSPPNRLNVIVYNSAGYATADWQWSRVEIKIPGTTPQATCLPYQAGSQITLPEIPFNAPFQLSVEMFSGTQECDPAFLSGRGISLSMQLAANTPAQSVSVMIAPVGTFVPTTGSIPAGQATSPLTSRLGASATVLPDGRVVIIGGARLKAGLNDNPQLAERIWDDSDSIEEIYDTVEIYDPRSGSFESLATDEASPQTLYYRRAFHSAVYLPKTKLIAVVGGLQQLVVGAPIEASKFIEFFDPAARTFRKPDSIGPLSVGRAFSQATLLQYNDPNAPDYLFVSGGTGVAAGSYEVVQMKLDELEKHIAGAGALIAGRWNHVSVLARNKDNRPYVYLLGGQNAEGTIQLIDIFNVVDGKMEQPPPGAQAPSELAEGGRIGHAALFVPGNINDTPNAVYVFGGWKDLERKQPVARIEVISADNGAQLVNAADNFNLNRPRGHHAATLLTSGQILVAGGLEADAQQGWRMVGDDELIGKVQVNSGGSVATQIRPVTIKGLNTHRFHHQVVPLPNDQALIVNGIQKVDTTIEMLPPLSTTTLPAELYIVDPRPIVITN